MKKLLMLAGALCVAAANAQITIGASAVPFIDISTTGTSIGTIGDDSETIIAGATIGWGGNSLLAGGRSVQFGNNGGVFWGNSATDTFTNATELGYINASPGGVPNPFLTMPASNLTNFGNGGSGPRQFLAVLWDDNFPATGASIRYQVIGTDLVIQWTNEDHFNAQGTGTITYEMIARGSGPSLVDFVYNDTLYAAQQYQNDGGSATIGYKNWGINGSANDVEYGIGGGNNLLADPAFGDPTMQPKVGGWVANENPALTHSVSIRGVPEPASMLAVGAGLAALIARRRRK